MKTRLRYTLLLLALSVAWAAFSLAGPFLLAMLGDHRPAEQGGRFVLSLYTGIFHLQKAPQTLAAPWFAEGLLFAALGALVTIVLVMLLDRRGDATRALRWSLRTIPCLIAWSCGVAILIGLIEWLGTGSWVGDLSAVIVYGYLLALPFIFLRDDVIARDRPPHFWLPRWPGLPTIVLSIAAFAAWYGIAIAIASSMIPSLVAPKAVSWLLGPLIALLIWILGLVLTASVLPSWKHRWKWTQLDAGFRSPGLLARARTLAALDLQLMWISLWLFVPVLLWVAAAIDSLVAYVESVQRLHLAHPPSYLPALVNVSHFAVSYWWIALLATYVPVYCWMLLAPRARALHLAESSGEPAP